MWRALLFLGCLGCQAPFQPVRDAGSGETSDPWDGEVSYCNPACGFRERCVGFRCVVDDAGTPDVAVRDVPFVPDRGPTVCCPMDPPSCGCVRAGGAVEPDGGCLRVCFTGGHDQWTRSTDRTGCGFWLVPDQPCVEDAGADVRDAADHRPDATADDRSDLGGEA